ncbi:hypothetical protein [Gryllotalpicola daejeonensis]|uniref:hypothetical protein n=1 Tax=Gryllotalpicola daejeonensis TaxID=993087 RepID=UPI0031D6ED77
MNWLDRYFPKSPKITGPAVGIGMLVAVVSDSEQTDASEDDPIGVVIAPGNNEIAAYPGLQRPPSWTVAFERPSYTADGRGPFEQATFPEHRLRVIDPNPSLGA